MPYSRQIHSTARGGSIFVVGFTPRRDRGSVFSLSQRRKVLSLTPAALASSYL